MEFYFTISYNGIQTRLTFNSFDRCHQAKTALRRSGISCTPIVGYTGDICRNAVAIKEANADCIR